jgi:hypothetical protein
MDGHACSERGDVFREFMSGAGAQAFDPIGQDRPSRFVESSDGRFVEVLRQRDGREAGAMQDFI